MIKVEHLKGNQSDVTKLSFECNSDADLETLDLIRVLILGDHLKRGMYVNGRNFVVEAKIPTKSIDDVISPIQ